MSRYIDADALKKRMLDYFSPPEAFDVADLMPSWAIRDGIEDIFETFPTADVVERRENPIDAEEVYWRFKDVDGHKNLVIKLKGMVTDVTDIRIRLDKYNLKEVVRGEWVFNSYDEDAYDVHGNKSWANRYYCSNCNFEHAFIEDHTGQYNYCPNCGAEMDERREDDKGRSD